MEPLEHLAALPALDGHPMAALALERLPLSASVVCAIRGHDGAVTDFRIEYSNAAATSLSDERTEIYGRPLFEVVPAFREVGLFQRFIEVLETGVPYTESDVQISGTYGGREYDLNIDVVATALGPDHVLSVSHDRTAERQASLRLNAVQATLGRRQHVERQVHDVNAGLVNDLVEVQRALDRGDLEEARHRAADGAARAAGVVTGLRAVTRGGA